MFVILYKALEIFYPTTKKYKQVLENAQRRVTKIVPELIGLSYRERLIQYLEEAYISALAYKRKRFDFIQVIKSH